jgi:hypothetical protein
MLSIMIENKPSDRNLLDNYNIKYNKYNNHTLDTIPWTFVQIKVTLLYDTIALRSICITKQRS